MKKVLLGTSAIALAGAFASQASAADWNVRVGGYMEQYAAYADSDPSGPYEAKDPDDTNALVTGSPFFNPQGDFSGIDSKQDAEIFFIPSITLDNGLQIGANVQLEGFSGGDNIDEAYMFIKGSFGEINLGSENSAGYKMMYAAPDVTFLNVNSGSLTSFIPFSGTDVGGDIFRGTLGSSYIEVLRNNDAQRFTYYTPRFAGFQLGVSYARDANQDSNAQVDCDAEVCDIVDIGANYVNSFGGFDIAISGRYGTAFVPGTNPKVWAAGANFGFSGFTIGGSYAKSTDSGTQDGRFWDAGISYETGPWGFSFTYADGKNKNNEFGNLGVDLDGDGFFTSTGDGGVGSDNERLKQYLLGISYKLAKGVTLNAFGAYVDFEEKCQDCEEIDGWVVGTGIKISF